MKIYEKKWKATQLYFCLKMISDTEEKKESIARVLVRMELYAYRKIMCF